MPPRPSSSAVWPLAGRPLVPRSRALSRAAAAAAACGLVSALRCHRVARGARVGRRPLASALADCGRL
eukprot:13930902-Alexandrium_andersonii.AAC.1